MNVESVYPKVREIIADVLVIDEDQMCKFIIDDIRIFHANLIFAIIFFRSKIVYLR